MTGGRILIQFRDRPPAPPPPFTSSTTMNNKPVRYIPRTIQLPPVQLAKAKRSVRTSQVTMDWTGMTRRRWCVWILSGPTKRFVCSCAVYGLHIVAPPAITIHSMSSSSPTFTGRQASKQVEPRDRVSVVYNNYLFCFRSEPHILFYHLFSFQVSIV